MKKLMVTLSIFAIVVRFVLPAAAVDIPEEVTLFKNVNIFDGENERLLEGYDVLVVKNLIKKIDKNIQIADTYEIDLKTGGYKEVYGGHAHDLQGNGDKVVVVYEPEKMIKKEVMVKVIDGQGRTLMPGLIDAHWHTMFNFWPVSKVMSVNFGGLSIAAAKHSEEQLLRGFTSVRDVGGNVFGVKMAIDSGIVDGPRIYPSGPYVGQTSGHGDFRGPNEVPENPGTPLDYSQRVGHTLVADGVPEVIRRTREILRMGASQVKAMAGGGVTIPWTSRNIPLRKQRLSSTWQKPGTPMSRFTPTPMRRSGCGPKPVPCRSSTDFLSRRTPPN